MYTFTLIQAYEEMAINAKLDKKRNREVTIDNQIKEQVEATKILALDTAKQKEALLTYVSYINSRHEEIQNTLEKNLEKER